MSTPTTSPVDQTCQFRKSNGELCKRTVRFPEDMCWQHAAGWLHKVKSLPHNQTLLFVLALLAIPSLLLAILQPSSTTLVLPGPPVPSPATVPKVPDSLHDLFKLDFDTALKITQTAEIGQGRLWSLSIDAQLYVDPGEKSVFVGYYIPNSQHLISACEILADKTPTIIADIKKKTKVTGGYVTDKVMTDMDDMVFTGRVYIYHEGEMRLQDMAKLRDEFEIKKLDLILRGPDYWAAHVALRPKS
jgi:hypothetical protein